MSGQPITIKVWCRKENLHQTADLLAQAVGHRIEIPALPNHLRNAYFFVITDIEQYDGEDMIRKAMGFDIIGKISGVIDWEVLPKEDGAVQPLSHENAPIETLLTAILDDLPIPVAIVQRTDGSYTWRWLSASGQSATYSDAVREALVHITRSYALIRSELMG
jgi:hypothetical protein